MNPSFQEYRVNCGIAGTSPCNSLDDAKRKLPLALAMFGLGTIEIKCPDHGWRKRDGSPCPVCDKEAYWEWVEESYLV